MIVAPVVVVACELKARYQALLTPEPVAVTIEQANAVAAVDAAHERLTGNTVQPAAQLSLDLGTQ